MLRRQPSCSSSVATRAPRCATSRKGWAIAGSVYHYYPRRNLFRLCRRKASQIIERVESSISSASDPGTGWNVLARAPSQRRGRGPISRITAIGLFAIHEMHCSGVSNATRPLRKHIRRLIGALPLQSGVDRSLLRLTLFGAMNWTWCGIGRDESHTRRSQGRFRPLRYGSRRALTRKRTQRRVEPTANEVGRRKEPASLTLLHYSGDMTPSGESMHTSIILHADVRGPLVECSTMRSEIHPCEWRKEC